MNYIILQKCVEGLKEEKPDISYIRGMLETLLAMQEAPITLSTAPPRVLEVVSTPSINQVPLDEAALLEAQTRAALAKMPPIQQE